jgi:hypothetical protein
MLLKAVLAVAVALAARPELPPRGAPLVVVESNGRRAREAPPPVEIDLSPAPKHAAERKAEVVPTKDDLFPW